MGLMQVSILVLFLFIVYISVKIVMYADNKLSHTGRKTSCYQIVINKRSKKLMHETKSYMF